MQLLPIRDVERRTERHLEARAQLLVVIVQQEFTLISRDDALSRIGLDELKPLTVSDGALEFRLAERLLGNARSRTTDVERAERQLGTRLSDGLSGEDADSLSQIDHRHRGQISTVAHPAKATS